MFNTALNNTGKPFKGSGKVWGVAACLAASFLFMAFQGGKLASMLFAIVLILSLYFALGRFSGIASARGMRQLNKGTETEFAAGTRVPVQIRISLPRFWLFPYVIVKDRLISHRGETLEFETPFVPDWRGNGEVSYVTPPLRRGVYRFGDTQCMTEDVFGLFQHHGTLQLNLAFRVYPQTVSIREWTHFHSLTKGMHHHSASTRAVRETTQINGVRDYVYGDRISRIHWNATARTGTWKSKEFEKETLPKTVLVLDCDRSAYEDDDQFELAVSVAASLFQYGLANELNLGLLSTDQNPKWIPAMKGETHYKEVMDHLIHVEADGKQPLDAVFGQFENGMAGGHFFIIVSPRAGESLSGAVRLILSRQLNACHFRILSGKQEDRQSYGEHAYRSLIRTYHVANLQELPVVLGGRPR